MSRTTSTLTCLIVAAAGLLLSGCGQDSPPTAVPVSDDVETSVDGSPSPAPLIATTVGTDVRDCPDAAVRWGQAEHSPTSDDDWPVPGRFVETSSGTILETITASRVPVDQTPLAGTRMTPDPSWPKDSVVLIDDTTGKVVETIHVVDDYFCAP